MYRSPRPLPQRRPTRTTPRAGDRPCPPAALVFHEVTLRSGVHRAIIAFKTGNASTVGIVCRRNGRPAGRFLIFSNDVSIVRRAITDSRRGVTGRADAGSIVTECGLTIKVWSRVQDGSGLVLFGRVDTETKAHVGGVTTLAGDEITALEQALEWLAAAAREVA